VPQLRTGLNHSRETGCTIRPNRLDVRGKFVTIRKHAYEGAMVDGISEDESHDAQTRPLHSHPRERTAPLLSPLERRPLVASVPALRLVGIRKRFGPRWILRDVSLDVGEGECVALLGPNGAGKTTLLRIAATVSRPDGGNIEVCGVDARKHPERARSFLSFLPQTAPLYAELTAREHLGWWGRMHDVAVGKDLVDAALVDAGLLKHARSRATALSRGQRQRLSLAMAFLPSPRLLLLDEPFAALDVEGRAWVEQRLMARRGLGATLVASHEPETIMRIAHRALRVADARVEAMA